MSTLTSKQLMEHIGSTGWLALFRQPRGGGGQEKERRQAGHVGVRVNVPAAYGEPFGATNVRHGRMFTGSPCKP